jgi:hypothetical protein
MNPDSQIEMYLINVINNILPFQFGTGSRTRRTSDMTIFGVAANENISIQGSDHE